MTSDIYDGGPFKPMKAIDVAEREELARYVGTAAKEAGDVGALITQTKLEMAAKLIRQSAAPSAPVVTDEMVEAFDKAHGVAMSEGRKWEDATREALEAALSVRGVGFRVEVRVMKESHPRTTYWVCLIRNDLPADKFAPSPADGYITPYKTEIRDHAYSEAAEWAKFLCCDAPAPPAQEGE